MAVEAARQAEARRAEIEAAVRAGFLTEADRLAAEARVASAAEAIASARAGVEIADAALRSLLEDRDGPVYGIAEPMSEPGDGPGAIEPLIAAALRRRPELEALRARLEAQRAAGRAGDARGYPRVVLYGAADYASPNRWVIPPVQELSPSWEVGALLTWSPNDTLDAVHRGEESAAEAAAIEAQLAQLERAVRLEVRRAHAQLRAAREAFDAARAAREAAETAYQSRLAQLRAGHATSADVFGSEGQVNAARLAELDAAVRVRLARAHLDYAVGR